MLSDHKQTFVSAVLFSRSSLNLLWTSGSRSFFLVPLLGALGFGGLAFPIALGVKSDEAEFEVESCNIII